MGRRFIAVLTVVMALGILTSARTIVWGAEGGGPDMDLADAAYAYCQPPRVEQAVYPEVNNELTACEQEWWNDGHPLPGGN